MPFSKISTFFTSSDASEQQKALATAQKVGTLGDKDATANLPDAVPAGVATADDAGPSIPAANTSDAGLTLAGLLDASLTPEDIAKLLAQETARRAAIAQAAETARQRALESAAQRATRERNAREQVRLEAELAALGAELAEATALFGDMRDALIGQAATVNALVVRHSRLHGQWAAVVPHEPGDVLPWRRPFRWAAREHGVDLAALERTG